MLICRQCVKDLPNKPDEKPLGNQLRLMTEVILSPPPPASWAVKTLGWETLILLSAASFICKAWRLAQQPFLNPVQPLGQLPCTASSQGKNYLGRGTGLVHHSTAAHSMRKVL